MRSKEELIEALEACRFCDGCDECNGALAEALAPRMIRELEAYLQGVVVAEPPLMVWEPDA